MATEFALVSLTTEQELTRSTKLSEVIEYIHENVNRPKDHVVKEFRGGIYQDFSSAYFLADKYPIPEKAPNALQESRFAEYDLDPDMELTQRMRGRKHVDEFDD